MPDSASQVLERIADSPPLCPLLHSPYTTADSDTSGRAIAPLEVGVAATGRADT